MLNKYSREFTQNVEQPGAKAMVYGGTTAPGCYKGKQLNIVSSFEALGQKIAGNISHEDFEGIIRNSCPGVGGKPPKIIYYKTLLKNYCMFNTNKIILWNF